MPTYSEWLDSTRALYTTAMTNAFNNRNNPDTDNSFYKAWQAMNSVGDLTGILPTNTAFYGASPNGDEADILLFQGYLQENPVVAGWLSLEPTLTFRADQRSSLGSAGTVGGQKRRWKGNPVYTFANGVLIGKDNQIVAAIGTEGGEDLDGFGTDTITYFDGVPFSTGTGVPGSVVFRGDTVVSGSIKGTGGVVIIDDVIQLETGVDSPAGIGVDSDGKIRLRHRGEGFIDLVDEINTVQANVDGATDTAANIAKLWQGVQNTSSAQWGTSLIPNSNFSFKTVDPSDGYSDRLVGVISVGTTNNIVTIPADGVCGFTGLSQGICLQAVPIESERYAIRIRYRGATAETLDSDGTEEGLFLSFHETTDSAEIIGDNTFIYDNSTPGAGYEGSSVHTSNVTVNYPTNTTSSDGGGATDGVTIQETYQVKSFVYEPNAGTTAASLVIYTKNYVDLVSIDYVVMTESPLTTTEVDGLITTAVGEIDVEVDDPDISVVTDPQMKDYTLWAGYNGATLANGTDGLTTGGDAAITVSVPAGGGGIVSSAIACESDRYLVGAKVRVLSSVGSVVPNVSMFAIENPNQVFSTIGNPSTTPLSFPSGDNVLNSIDIVKLDSSGIPDVGGAGSDIAIPIAELDGSEPLYTTFVGTYEVNVVYVGTDGTEYETFNPSIQTTAQLPGNFSLVVYADTECELSVDYVYGRLQGASVNIAQALADTAYTDAHGFVTDMNEQLIKESGSIITNASMAILDSNNKPSGWRTDTATGTLALDTTGDNSIKITQVPGFDSTTEKLRLITPTFNLGTADKFSVGISVRGISSAINVTTKVAVCTDSILPSSYVTIAQNDGGNADVLVLNVTESSIDGPTAVAANGTDAYENILVTWNRGDVQQTHGGMGSIIIEADGDFEVDFVFVKEQTVSFNLADAQAEARRDEAIRSAAGFVSSIGDSLAEEAGSFITNAAFTSWYLDSGSGKQRPQKWLATRGASSVVRAIASSEVVITEPADLVTDAEAKETVVTGKGINGSALRFDPGTSIGGGGILSSKFQLPVGSSWTNPDTSSVETTTGSYTLSVRLKLNDANLVGVRLYAHEYFSLPTGTENHVFCQDGSYGDTDVEGADRTSAGTPLDELKMFTATDPEDTTNLDWGQVQRIKVINVATNDLSVGYDPDDGTANSADEYVEYLPVDTGKDDGDRDGTFNQNIDVWYDISGTYRPHEKAKVVSFEILVEGDADSGGTAPLIYVDYVSLITQPFDTDFAQTLADARAESIATIKTGELSTTIGLDNADWTGSSYFGNTSIAELLIATRNDVDAVETALAAEDPASTLIPNSFFGSPETGTSVDDWIPTRSTTGTITRTNTSANGSYGSYITIGSTPAGEEIHGLLSKAISVLGDGTTTTGLIEGGLAQNPNFDLVIRYRADSTEQVSWQMIAHEFYSDSLTGQNQYVFENGYGNLVAGQSGVELFNGGVTGNAVVLTHIFTDNDTTTESESSSASTNWLTLVGTYKPTANARWVSFEFVLNEDKDNNDTLPSVQIDGILLQQSTVDGGLAASIKATAEAAQIAADAAQTTADGNATDISSNSDLITVNIGNISTNSSDISTNSGNISTNTGNISSIQTSVALMKAADTELFLIQTAMANETDSKIPNAAFLQPSSLTVTNNDGESVPNLAIPGSFLQFHRTPFLFRATNEFATNTAITSAYTDIGSGTTRPESVDTPYYDVGQNGTALIVPAVARNQDVVGFYTSAVIIPNAGGTGTSSGTQDPATGDNDFTGELSFDSRGQYTISFKVKNLSNVGSESITVSIKAHEYYSGIGPATEAGFITEASAQYQGFGAGISTGIGTPYSSDNDQTITIIKLSDASDTTFGSSEQLAQGSGWVTIGGTYTASANCECVSFSLSVDIDDDNDDTEAYDQNNDVGQFEWYNIFPALAVDFIYCASQSFTADMAEQITASRVYTVQQSLTTTIESVQEGINEQTPGLIFNSDFKNIINTGNKAKGWIAANTLENYVESKPYDSGVGSIDRYVHLQKSGSGQFASIISKGVGAITDESRNADGSIGTYVIAVKARGRYTDGTNTYYQGSPTTSQLSQFRIERISGGTSSSGDTSSVLLPSDAGAYQGWYDDDNYALNEEGSTTVYRRYPTGSGTHNGIFKFPVPGKKVIFWATVDWDGIDSTGDAIEFVPIVDPEGSPTVAANPLIREIRFCRDSSIAASAGTLLTVTNSVQWEPREMYNSGYPSDQYFIQVILTANEQIEGFQLVTTRLESGEVFRMGALYQVGAETDLDGDFSVKMYAHESNSPGDATHVVNASTPYETPHSDLEITTVNSDNTVPLTIIDLGYGSAEADTEAEILNEESSLDTWRTIIGSYKPTSEDRRMTSFEFYFDMDEDGDGLYQQIYIDSVTLLKSAIDGDVAESIAENRVFLESNQTMGGATVSNNNILFNADFSMPQGETTATRAPAGWYPLREYNSTQISVSTPLAYDGSNRDMRFDTSDNCHGFVSKAFSIDYDKYRVRLTLDLNGSSATAIQIRYWATTGIPGFLEKCICSANYWPDISSGISYHTATNEGRVQNGIISDSGVYTVEYEWNPYGTNDNWESAWNWASIGVYYNASSGGNPIVKALEVYPIGHPFTRTPTGRGAITRTFGGGIFDFGGRSQVYETDVPEPLYDAIDIAIDTDTSITQALLMSEVRYEYGNSDGSGGSTAKYKYPAESPIEIRDQDSRTTITVKPDDKYNTLNGLQWINLDSNYGSVAGRIDGNSYGLVLAPQTGSPPANPSWNDAVTIIGPLVVAHDNPPYFWEHEDQWYNGTTGILLKQKDNNFYNGLMIQNPAVDTDSNDSGTGIDSYPTWAIYIGNKEKYIRFAYGVNTDTVDTDDHWFMKSEGHMSTNTSNAPRSIGEYLSTYTFTGAHISLPSQEDPFEIGMIVISSGKFNNISFLGDHPLSEKATISESLPTVLLANKRNQKSVFGVVAEIEDPEESIRKLNNHNALGRAQTKEDNRLIVNSLGEGAVWICDINGDLENGDYITTCEIPGYGMRQDDDLLHNYTVAKITQDCTFELDNPFYDCVEFEFEGNTYRKAFVGCTYHCG